MRVAAFLSAMCILLSTAVGAEPMKALIVDGQNNHGVWPQTTKMMKSYLEETGLFTVDVATAAPKGTDPNFKPEFSKYKVVISNFGYGAAPWPEETQKAFEEFVRNGGGFVVVHAADNSFPEWPAYNEMIGLGGWGIGRKKMALMSTSTRTASWFAMSRKVRAGTTGLSGNFRSSFVIENIRSSKGCRSNGCMQRMSCTTSSADRQRTCRFLPPPNRRSLVATNQ